MRQLTIKIMRKSWDDDKKRVDIVEMEGIINFHLVGNSGMDLLEKSNLLAEALYHMEVGANAYHESGDGSWRFHIFEQDNDKQDSDEE